MSQDFHIDAKWEDKVLTMSFFGALDENSEFGDLDPTQAEKVIFDLKDLYFTNSVGLRTWVQFVQKIPQDSEKIFMNCQPAVIHQLNILDGFMPFNARVQSLYVPYSCDDCGHEKADLHEYGNSYTESENKIPHEVKCPECGAEMELSTHPTIFFKFLEGAKQAA